MTTKKQEIITAKESYDAVVTCYNEGIITPERVDEAVKRILFAQHKVLNLPQDAEITESDIKDFEKINRSIYAKTDDDTPVALDKNGKYFFAVIVKNEMEVNDQGKVTVDTFTNEWYNPNMITEKIEKLFSNSYVRAIPQFPTAWQNECLTTDALEYDEVIFINFAEAPAFTGSDHITRRMLALINSMQMSDRVHTIVHFGNPFVLQELNHMKRIIIGGISTDATMAGLDVLAGDLEATGVLTYDVDFQ